MTLTDPLSNDTDGDGLQDGEEVMLYYSDPRSNDTDRDGLDDGLEVSIETGIRTMDTDRDGLDDGEELVLGTDPLHPDNDGGGLADLLEIVFRRDPKDPDDDFPVPDRDGDGLDDLSEAGYGCSPDDPDSDGDGLLDGQEALVLFTDPADPDTDGDELEDGAEATIGTDPASNDTDLDGLLDGEEFLDLRTEPLMNDTDLDGLLDGEEIDEWGTDPLDPDTDGDGLDDGLEVLVLGTQPGRSDSDGGGADDGLEVLRSYDPLDPGDDHALKDTDSDGLTDIEENNIGTDPLEQDSDLDGVMDSHEVWGTLGPVTDPLDDDSDDDNLTDGEELYPGADGYLTDPNEPDTDGDNITDEEETRGLLGFVSDPASLDGDSDGLPDRLELLTAGTDPLDADSDDDGLPDGWVDGWAGGPLNGERDPGEYEDRDLDGEVDPGPWNDGTGPGETDPRDPDTDGGGAPDGFELLNASGSSDPLWPEDDAFVLDSDLDGLTDQIENMTGSRTRWDVPDTDGDGLLDGQEDINRNGIHDPGETNASNPDTDGDRVPDGKEASDGTDPTHPDTDGDGLWDGLDVFDGKRYHRGERQSHGPYGPTNPLEKDTDGDGLLDGNGNITDEGTFTYGENDFGTDPNDPDTDRDGLPDPDEGLVHGTDPLDRDSDDGGAPDGLEVRYGQDPLDPSDDDILIDTDGDGLSNRMERTQLYYDETEVDWDSNGKPDHFPDWSSKDTDGDGLDDGFEVLNPEHPTNPLLSDTDGDGLSDLDEVMVHGTDPTDPDSDGDGLKDGYELTMTYERSMEDWNGDGLNDNRTDPVNPDTDLDSVSDGDEVVRGSNPLDRGDPGTGSFLKVQPRLRLTDAPNEVRKYVSGTTGSFSVEGIAQDGRGGPLYDLPVAILLAPGGTTTEDAIGLDRNQDLVVGTGLTGPDGSFRIACRMKDGSPYGQVLLFVVSPQTRSQGVLFLKAVSAPIDVSVFSGSRIDMQVPEVSAISSSTVLVHGRLADTGGLSVSGAIVSYTLGNESGSVVSGTDGGLRVLVRTPAAPGVHTLSLSFGGDDHLGPASARVTVRTVDIQVLELVLSDTIVETSSVLTASTGRPAEAIVGLTYNISVIDGKGTVLAYEKGEVLAGGIEYPMPIDPDIFGAGRYDIYLVIELTQGPVLSDVASFQVVEVNDLVVTGTLLVRGEENLMRFSLRTAASRVYPGAHLNVEVTGATWFSTALVTTNSTGVAALEVFPPSGSVLGHFPLAVTVLDDDGNSLQVFSNGAVSVVSTTELIVTASPERLVLGTSAIVQGRLLDDSGGGIVGTDAIQLRIDGEEVAASDLRDGGFFAVSYPPPVSMRPGSALPPISFSDLLQSPALYLPAENRSLVPVLSSTSLSALQDNGTLFVRLHAASDRPLPGMPVRIGTGSNFTTVRTDANGTAVHGLPRSGSEISVDFDGDELYLPSTLIVTVSGGDIDGAGFPWVLLVGALAMIVMIGAISYLSVRLVSLRRRSEGMRMLDEVKGESYRFSPKGPVQARIVGSYRALFEDLMEKGVRRPEGMTPNEFKEVVKEAVKEDGYRDLTELTALFLEARYSDHDMDAPDADRSETLQRSFSARVGDDEAGMMAAEKAVEAKEPGRAFKYWHDHNKDLRDLLGEKEGGF